MNAYCWAMVIAAWTVEGEPSVDVLHHHGERHQHHRGGHTTEDEAKKSKTRAVGSHDTSLSSIPCR